MFIYIGYGIGFDLSSGFSLPDGSTGKTVIIFVVNMGSSVHIDNKKKYILILGKGSAQALDDTTLTAETQYSIHFSRSFHYLLMLKKIYQFKAKILK